MLHATLKLVQRLGKGNVVLIFADNGWKYLGTNLWTASPADASEDEVDSMDETIWW